MSRIILRDGRTADMRVPEATDHDRSQLRELFRRASRDSLYFRFFHVVAEVSDGELEQMMAVDPLQSFALVCDAGDRILAIGNYVRSDHNTAEVALFCG